MHRRTNNNVRLSTSLQAITTSIDNLNQYVLLFIHEKRNIVFCSTRRSATDQTSVVEEINRRADERASNRAEDIRIKEQEKEERRRMDLMMYVCMLSVSS